MIRVSAVVASFTYRDRAGEPVGRVDRIEPGRKGRNKDFLQNGFESGSYSPGLNGATLPLYNLPDVERAIKRGETIFVTEGEGKADRLAAALKAAKVSAAVTTIAGGANAPMQPEHIIAFKGAPRIVVLADSDSPGRACSEKRASKLAAVYPDADARAVDLYSDRDDGSDVADWIDEGHDVTELRAIVDAATRVSARIAQSHAAKTGSGGAKFVTIGDLLEESDEDVEPLVEGILRCGSTALVASKPKVGKTSFGMNLAVATARGTPFLGRATKKGTVLYVALEGNRTEWRGRFRAMGATGDDALLLYVGQAPQDAMTWLRDNAEEHKPILIIVDTLQRLARLKDMNDYAAITNASEPLIAIAQSFNATLVLMHHAKKNSDGDDGDSVLGSTALYGFVDTLITLKKGADGRRTMKTSQRYGEDVDETVLTLDPKTKLVSASGARSEVDRAACEVDILATLTDEWVDRATLLADIDARASTKNAALKALVDDGRAARTGSGRKGDPNLYALAAAAIGEPENNSIPGFPRSSGNQKTVSEKSIHGKGLFDSRLLENAVGNPETRETNISISGNAGNDFGKGSIWSPPPGENSTIRATEPHLRQASIEQPLPGKIAEGVDL